MSIGGSSDKKGSPNGETLIEKKICKDKELAKLAGVGTGTIVWVQKFKIKEKKGNSYVFEKKNRNI